MKARLGLIRKLIKEEYLNGVPEWQLRQDASDFVAVIRQRIESYVLVNKSQTGVDRADAFAAMNDVCDNLESRVYDVLEDSLFAFTRKI